MSTRSGLTYSKAAKNTKYFSSLEELKQARPHLFEEVPCVFRSERNILGTDSGFLDIIVRTPPNASEHRDLLLSRVYNWILKKYPFARYQTIVVSNKKLVFTLHSFIFSYFLVILSIELRLEE